MESLKFLTDYEFLSNLPDDFAQSAKDDDLRKWIKFTFTDDQPNGNGMMIPKEEFRNIVRTGAHMPMKMERGNPKGDHVGSIPIGAIASLKEDDNKVIGIAALWKEEYPEEIQALEEAHAGGEPLDLSWELYFDKEASLVNENGIHILKGTNVKGSVFVGNPAYEGRTQVLTMAQKDKTQEENELTDTNTPDVAALQTQIAEMQSALDTAKSEIQSKLTELDTASSELTSLREFKQTAEAEKANNELALSRRNELKEAGITYTDDEFAAKKASLVSMNQEAFDFYKNELVAFSSVNKPTTPASAGMNNPNIPDLTNTDKDPKAILKAAFKSVN